MSSEEIEAPQWNVFYRVDKLSSQKDRLKIEAQAEDLEEIADWFGVNKIEGLKADIKISRPNNNHLIYVNGTLYATVEQRCVRSLKPVITEVEEVFDAYFSETDKAISFEKGKSDLLVRYGQDEVPMLDEKDDPEPVVDGVINMGELVLQFFALAIPQYPKAEGVEDDETSFPFDDEVEVKQAEDASEKYSPFKELANWRSNVELDQDAANEEKDDKK